MHLRPSRRSRSFKHLKDECFFLFFTLVEIYFLNIEALPFAADFGKVILTCPVFGSNFRRIYLNGNLFHFAFATFKHIDSIVFVFTTEGIKVINS